MISDILEIWSQALRLATLSALPVPMLRQVFAWRIYVNGVFAWDVFQKREDGDVNTMLL